MSEVDDLIRNMDIEVGMNLSGVTGGLDLSAMAMLRDSQIIIVDEEDEEHPLKLGEYYYDLSANILYVGGSYGSIPVPPTPPVPPIWEWVKHWTSFLTIPAPRVKTSFDAVLADVSRNISYIIKPLPRIHFNYDVTLANVTHDESTRITDRKLFESSRNVSIPSVSYQSSIVKL